VRLRETLQVAWAFGFPVLLPQINPRWLVIADGIKKQIVLFDLAAPDDAGGIMVAKTEFPPVTAALSADGDSLCIGDLAAGGSGYSTRPRCSRPQPRVMQRSRSSWSGPRRRTRIRLAAL
jgi:hypothetical protein